MKSVPKATGASLHESGLEGLRDTHKECLIPFLGCPRNRIGGERYSSSLTVYPTRQASRRPNPCVVGVRSYLGVKFRSTPGKRPWGRLGAELVSQGAQRAARATEPGQGPSFRWQPSLLEPWLAECREEQTLVPLRSPAAALAECREEQTLVPLRSPAAARGTR